MISYHVYSNGGTGGPIDYGAPVATVAGGTWSFPLPAPGAWSFGVRAFGENGEEENLDCSAACVLDANGGDLTRLPSPPAGLRAFGRPSGAVRLEWWSPSSIANPAPLGFNVYIGEAPGPPNYESPAASVPYSAGVFGMFAADIEGLQDGTLYVFGVRAFNASGLERNVGAVVVAADSTGPGTVDLLTTSIIA